MQREGSRLQAQGTGLRRDPPDTLMTDFQPRRTGQSMAIARAAQPAVLCSGGRGVQPDSKQRCSWAGMCMLEHKCEHLGSHTHSPPLLLPTPWWPLPGHRDCVLPVTCIPDSQHGTHVQPSHSWGLAYESRPGCVSVSPASPPSPQKRTHRSHLSGASSPDRNQQG